MVMKEFYFDPFNTYKYIQTVIYRMHTKKWTSVINVDNRFLHNKFSFTTDSAAIFTQA